MDRPKHIAVCGAGVVGLCCAHFLRERGHEVTVIERGAADHDSCAAGSAGFVVPSHFVPLACPGMVSQGLKWMLRSDSPFYVRPRLDADLIGWAFRFARASNAAQAGRAAQLLARLNIESRKLFEGLEASLHDDFGLTRRGLLTLCNTERAMEGEVRHAAAAQRLGIEAELVTPSRAAELDPAVRMDIVGGVYFPSDCHLTPGRLLAALSRSLEKAGVRFMYSTEITGWRTGTAKIEAARAGAAEIIADEFVIATGSWSQGLVRGLGLKLPMQPGKGYSLTLEKPRRLPRLCSLLSEARIGVTPMGSSMRVAGTMELSGFDRKVRPERVRQIIESTVRYFPEFTAEDFRDVPVWQGFRPCSPDGLPYVGRAGRHSNLCLAAGHAMMGVSMAPITGHLVAQILAGENPAVAIKLLDPNRYA